MSFLWNKNKFIVSNKNKFEKVALEENTMFNQLISNIKNSGLSASEIEIELDNLFLAKKDITSFDKYFLGINNQISKILSQDILLAFEAYTQGIGDTSQRGLLMDAVLDYLEMRPWPINGEGDDVFIEFCRELKDKASHHSITFPVEE